MKAGFPVEEAARVIGGRMRLGLPVRGSCADARGSPACNEIADTEEWHFGSALLTESVYDRSP